MWVVLQMMDGDQDQDLDQCTVVLSDHQGVHVHHGSAHWCVIDSVPGHCWHRLIDTGTGLASGVGKYTQAGEFSTLGLEQIVFYTQVES